MIILSVLMLMQRRSVSRLEDKTAAIANILPCLIIFLHPLHSRANVPFTVIQHDNLMKEKAPCQKQKQGLH